MVDYYRDVWHKPTHISALLTKICYTKVKFNFTDIEHESFIEMKKIVYRGVLLYTLILVKSLEITQILAKRSSGK